MRIAAVLGSVLLVIWTATTTVRADVVVFKVPTTNLKFILQGKAITSRTQPTIYFTHTPSKLIFDLPQTPDTDVIVLPTLNQIASKRLSKMKGDEAGSREVAAWALDHGLLAEFHRAVDQIAAANAADPFVVEAKRLKADLAKPIAEDSPEAIKSVSGSGSKIVKSAHFLMGYPENDKPADKSEIKKKKPEARLEQLEQLFEIFVMKCAERGLPVQIPTTRMLVMVSSGAAPSTALPGARTAPLLPRILWAQGSNILYISQINAQMIELDSLRKLQSAVTKVQSQPRPRRNPNGQPGGGAAPGGGMADAATVGGIDLSKLSLGQVAKLVVTVQSLMAIGTDNLELEGLSREAAYLFIANCNVVPPQAPSWVRDGLAAYFEYPAEMGFLKIGDVGQVRSAWYQASLQDPDRFTLTDIVTGRCHDNPVSFAESMRASNMSWALMHFLLENNAEGLGKYLTSFRAIPPDLALDDDVLSSMFDDAFGEEQSKLEETWREHMTGLKAEYSILKDSEEGGTTSDN
ncbi:MAG: DUF1570 domain-containing protein [Planctomycetota bacterium]